MLWLYRLFFLPVLLLASPYYLRRMRRRGGYGENFGQRFGGIRGLPPKRAGVRRVWLQAVSVGEVLAVAPILEALKQDPSIEVFLSTTTSTGGRLAKEKYAGLTIGIGYFPLDFWAFSARAWRRIAPDLAVITEGERWPEHIHQARRRGVPLVGVNARMSDRSFRRMGRVRFLARPLLGGIGRLLAVSEHDAERFRALGFPAERLRVTGNIKLDLTIPPLTDADRARLRRELGLAETALVLLGASTWPGEEAALLAARARAQAAGVECALLLVPRHAERRGEIAGLLEKSGRRFHLRSRGPAAGAVEVAVGDTTGELRALTQLAGVVFVGKSLPPHREGQTPVEAAALGKPVLFGPGMSNFRAIARELAACGAALVVADEAALADEAAALLRDADRRAAMAAAAVAWHRANQGAVARTLAALGEYLPRAG